MRTGWIALALWFVGASGCGGDEVTEELAPPGGPPDRLVGEDAGAALGVSDGCAPGTCLSFAIAPEWVHPQWGPWLQGSSIALTRSEDEAIVADADNGAVLRVRLTPKIEAGTGSRVRLAIDMGATPEQVLVGPDDRIWVSLRDADAVALIEGDELTATIPTGKETYGLALSPNRNRLYATHVSGQEVAAIDTDTLEVVWRLSVAADPRGVTVTPEGDKLHIAHAAPGQVTVVGLPEDEPPDRRNTDVRPLADHPAVPFVLGNPLELTPNRALAAVSSPSGRRIYVPHVVCDEEAPRSGRVGPAYYGGADRPAIKPIVSVMNPLTGRSQWAEDAVATRSDAKFVNVLLNMTFDRIASTNLPAGAAHHPTHSMLLVAMQGTDHVVAYSTATDGASFATVSKTEVSAGPKGIAIRSDGAEAYVHAEFARRIDVLRLNDGRLATDDWVEYRIGLGASDRSPAWQRGRTLFHSAGDPSMVSSGHVACAGCHPDGRTDRLVWSFAPGDRNAPLLAGRLEGTGPFNWLGDMAELDGNVRRSITRMGGSGLSDLELQSLTTYISEGLMPPRNPWPERLDADVIAQGREIFESDAAGCAGCHGGEDFTDNQVHVLRNVSERVNTPSLRGLWASAPYYHDGRYATLRELLVIGGQHMGDTTHLNPGQLDALEAYLKTL